MFMVPISIKSLTSKVRIEPTPLLVTSKMRAPEWLQESYQGMEAVLQAGGLKVKCSLALYQLGTRVPLQGAAHYTRPACPCTEGYSEARNVAGLK